MRGITTYTYKYEDGDYTEMEGYKVTQMHPLMWSTVTFLLHTESGWFIQHGWCRYYHDHKLFEKYYVREGRLPMMGLHIYHSINKGFSKDFPKFYLL